MDNDDDDEDDEDDLENESPKRAEINPRSDDSYMFGGGDNADGNGEDEGVTTTLSTQPQPVFDNTSLLIKPKDFSKIYNQEHQKKIHLYPHKVKKVNCKLDFHCSVTLHKCQHKLKLINSLKLTNKPLKPMMWQLKRF